MAKNISQKEFYSVLGSIGVVLALVLVVGAGFARLGYNFATSRVRSQLVQEKITFPAAGSAGLSASEFPGLQRYGGQAVDTGPKAKAYADEFIWEHMMKASGGKTYAEVSSAAQAAPTDAKLAALKNVLFQGDMLRSSLLTAYAFSVFGMVSAYAACVALIGAGVMLLLALLAFVKARA
ncbi:MAG TPA: hypothetical protein VLE72_03145 [Candidatus Saccharimonadales bacterium]|nr:hypothetical protein [Candidatus Saccharimonadales bacterium]